MEQVALYEEFTALMAARNWPRLRQLATHIEDSDPRAPEMLNCIGFSLCLDAKNQAELQETVRYLERAATLPAIPVQRAKILVNLAGFYNWLNQPANTVKTAEKVFPLPLEPAQTSLYGLAHHHAGQGWLLLREYARAQWAYQLTIANANGNAVGQSGHLGLANFAAANGDEFGVEEHVKPIVEAHLKVYILPVRARLALAQCQVERAKELAYEAMQRFTAMEIRPSTWSNQFEARLLYARVLEATGDLQGATRIRATVADINGGVPYVSVWEGIV